MSRPSPFSSWSKSVALAALLLGFLVQFASPRWNPSAAGSLGSPRESSKLGAPLLRAAAAGPASPAPASPPTAAALPPGPSPVASPSPSPAQAQGSGLTTNEDGAAPKAPREEPDMVRRRDEWFYGQRAYPLKQIPPGARQQAIDQMNQAIQRDIQMGIRPATSGSTNQPAPEPGLTLNAAAPGYPAAASWVPLGPAPTNIPSGAGANLGQSTTSGRITSIAVDRTNPNIVYVGSAEGGVWKTTNAGANWTTNSDQQPSLAIGALAIDPTSCSPGPCTTIYAGTGEANFNQDAYSGAGVLKSTDGGNTWVQSSPNGAPFAGAFGKNSGGALIGALAVSPTNGQIVLAGVTGSASGIYRSTDGGQTWTQVQSGASGTAVVFDPIDGNTAYAALGTNSGSSSNGIYKSTNAGQTWTNIPLTDFFSNPIPASSIGRIALAVAPSTTGSTLTIYATIANVGGSNLLGFFTSINAGTTWSQTDPNVMPNFCVTQCWYDMAVTVNPFDPFDVIVGGSAYLNNQSTLFRSLAGGPGPWVDITTGSNGVQPHVDTHAFGWAADTSKLYVGNDGGVWRSDNPQFAIPNWLSVNETLNIAQFYTLSVHPTSDNVALGGTQDNGTQLFSAIPTWNYTTCGDGGYTIFETQIPTTVYSVCEGGDINRSLNSGVFGSFFPGFTSGIVPTDRMAFIPPLFTPGDTGNPTPIPNPAPLYFGTFRVYQSFDRGVSWTPISPDLTLGNGHITSISSFRNNSNLLLVGTSDGRIWQTSNASLNATWTNLNTATLPNRVVTSVSFDHRNPNILFASFSGFSGFGDTVGHVFMSTNGGATWVDISCTVANCGSPNIAGGDLPNIPVNSVAVTGDDSVIFAATDIGVFFSSTVGPGAVWSVLGTGLPKVAILGFGATTRGSGVATVFTHGRGAWRIQLPFGTGPESDISSVTPPSATVGDPDTTITIDGFNFTASTVVKWTINSTTSNLATTFISPNRLTALIPSAQLAAANLASLSLSDPAVPFGGDILTYVVANPMPQPSGFSTSPPGSIPVNSSFTVTATGKGFVCPGAPNDSGIRFRGTVFQPTTCTTTSITATIPAGNNNRTGQFGIRVINSLPGGGPSSSFISVDIVPASAPANDAIATPVVIAPAATVNFSDTQPNQIAATQDTGGIADPVAQCAVNDGAAANGNTRSIWYSFTPGANGAISVDAIGSSFNAVLSAWTGAPGSLSLAAPNACSDAFSSTTGVPQFTFSASSSTTYFFMLSGFGQNSGGQSVFNLVFTSTGGAQFTLQPSSLTFSNQNVGTISAEKDFHVINTGSANVSFTGISLTGTNPSDFILISPTDGSQPCPLGASVLAPSASCGVGVLFYPADTSTITLGRSASVAVASPSGNQNVTLTGSVFPYARASVSPTSLTFAGTLIGTANATPQTITVTNTGSASLTINQVQVFGNSSSEYATSPPTSGTNCLTSPVLATSAACSFRVSFTPSGGGTRAAQVSINESAASILSSQQTVLLTGTGTSNSTLTITPASSSGSPIAFPSTAVGSTSAPQALTLTNSSGTTPISIQHIALGGANPSDFNAAISGSTCLGLNSIPAGQSCVINGVFQPSQVGTRTASLLINDDATNGPHTVFLSGNATGGAAAVTLSPTALTFPSQNTGTPSAPQNVVLTNIGSASLNITSITLTGTNPTDFSVSGTGSTPCPVAGGAVAAQASCTFSVIFNPTSASPSGRSAIVSINESPNSTTAPDQVTLAGTAVAAPTVKFTPTSVSFGSRSVGTTSAVSNVQLQNVGTATLTAIGGATVGGANAGDFSLVAPTNGDTACTLGSNFNVNAGATCSVGVKFSPTTSGARSGAVVFITNAAGTPNTVALSGTGTGGQIFTLATSGKWETPGNWSPSGPPGPQDTAVIPSGLTVTVDATTGAASVATLTSSGTVVVSGGSLTVASGSTANVLTLGGGTLTANGAMTVSGASTLSAGALDGTGTVTFSSTLNWSGGAMTGSGSTVIGATTGALTISGAGGKALTSRALTINGGVAVTGTGTVTVTSSVITNNAAGTFDFQTDAAFSGAGTFNNAGTLKKSAGAGTGGLVVPGVGSAPAFTNTGTVQALSGTFAFQGGFAQTAGSTTVAASAGLNTGTFTLTLTGGTLSGNGTVIGNVSNGGTLNPGSSPGTFNITGNYTQTSAGVLNLEIGGTSAGNFDVLAISSAATLAGTVNATSFNSFTPTPGNVFQVMTFSSKSGDFTTKNLTVNGVTLTENLNPTNLILSAGSSNTFIGGGGNNKWENPANWSLSHVPTAAETAVIGGSFSVLIDSTTGAQTISSLSMTSTGTLTLSGGSLTFSGASSATNLAISGGTLTANGALTVSGASTLSSGGLDGSAVVTFTGSLNWSGGSMIGSGSTVIAASTGSLNFSGSGSKSLSRTLTNGGSVTVTGTGELTVNGAAVTNQAGATFDFQADGNLTTSIGLGSFTNAGTLKKSGGAGLGGFVTPGAGSPLGVTSTGTMLAQSGTFGFQGGFTQTAGSTTVGPGGLSGTTFAINGGTLSGTGTITGNLSNGGTVSPGSSPGTLSLTGTYTQTAAGTLTFQIGGTGAGQFSVLAISGTATLAGTLTATSSGGFTPVVGNSFQVMTFASKSGDFTTNNLSFNGITFVKTFLSGSLTLDVAASAVTLAPTSVPFGNRRITTTSASTHVQLTNSGTATLNITSIAKGGTDPTQFNLISAANGATPACPLGASQLTAGNACNFDVQFAPTTTGLKGAVINVTDDASGSPQQVTLSGTGTVPTASVPSPLAFGDRPINQKAVLPLTLTNTGSDTLNLAAATAVALSGTDAAKFSIEAGTTCVNGLAIPPAPGPGNTCVVNVGFTPDTVKNGYAATLTFTDDSGAVAGSQQLVTLSGNGVTASILLAPSPADFGNQRKGTTSAGKVVTVTNSGGLAATLDATTPVSLTGTNAAEFAISGSTCTPGLTMAAAPGPNNTCTVTLTFTPSGLSQRTATLNIFDNATGSPQTDTLLGTGIAPGVVLNPTTTVSFPDQIVSTTSSAQTVTLTNNGTDTLNIATVVIDPASPNAADFAIAAGTTCTNASQVGFTAPNNTCIVNLTFTPGASGARGPAVLKFTDDANAVAGTVQQLNLQGNGLTPPTAGLSTAAINFGNQRQGTTSAPQTVKITNSGTAQLAIASIIFDAASVNPGDFVLSTTGLVKPCPLAGGNVAGGDFCNFNVAFGPTATGARSARVRITDNANATGIPGSTQFVDLSGAGTLPTASVPSPLAFGDRPINQKSVLPVTLTNTGTDTLNLAAAGAVALSGTDAAKFSIEAGTTCVNGLAVPPAPGPGNTCVINVGFTPDTVKAGYTATLTLTDDSGGVAGTQQAVALSGNGVTASVLPTPSPVNFGNQRVGTPSAVKVVTVTNSGGQSATLDPTTPLTITGANAGDFAISLTTCAPGLVLAAAPGPGNTCTVSLTFTPSALALRSATLNIFDSATGSPQTDSLQGTGVAPSFAYSPTSVPFGSQIIATTSAVTNVTLSNGGTDTLNVTSLALTGADAAEFNLVAATAGSPQCSLAGAFQVAAGQSCVFGVSFSPLTAVGKVAAVRSTDDASGSPHDLAVTGTGVTPPTANLSTAAVPFGNQRVGTTSSATTVTITNNGGAVLAIQSVSIDPASANPSDFLLAAGAVNPCPLGGGNVAPGGNCTFTVAFKPTVQPPAAESATVNILDNANATGTPGSKQTVSLTGTGIFPAITMAPTSKDFGNQRVGTTSSPAVSFTLTNSGTDTLNISKIALDTTGNPGDFVLTAGTCNLNGGQLAPSANCTLNVAFAPTATGLRSTNVVITSDVTPSVKVPLQGTGIFPAITLAPTSKDFGNQRVGTTSTPAVVVTMTNSGTDTLNFSTIALGAAGNPGDFLLAAGGGTPCNLGAGGQLAVNANCTFTVAFKPTAVGARSASVVITSDVTPSATVPLTGTGIAPAVTLSPATKAFGNQNVNTSSAVTNVTLTNSGTDTLNVSSIALAGTDTSQFALVFQANGATAACSAAGGALAPNASCNFATKFAPTTLSPSPGKSANVTVTSDASTSPDRFTMTGTATAPVVSLSTTTVALGNVQVGDSKTGAAVTLTNTGTGPLTIATIVVGAAPPPGTGNADFTLLGGTGACANGAQIPPAPGPGNSCTLTVRLAPTATGARAAVVTLTDDDQAVANSTQTLTLSGTGVDFSVAQATPGTVQVTGGTPATVALNLTTTPSGAALPNDVNFACASTESTLTCTANPAKITAGSTSGSTTITINSVATLLPPPTSRPDPRLFYLLCLAALAAALQVLLWRAGRRRGRRIAGLAYYLPLVLLLASLAGIAGCAGARSTPKGANTVTVTSTSGTVAKQTVINLNVN